MASAEGNQEASLKAETDITAGIQAELDHLIATGGTTGNTTGGVMLTNPTLKTTVANNANSTGTAMTVNSINAPNTLLIPSQANTVRTIAASGTTVPAAGATQILTIPAGADANEVVQKLAKRTLPASSSGQVVTKVIITRNPVTKQPVSSAATVVTGSTASGQPTMIRTADGRQLLSTSGSPIKFVTVSSAGGLAGKNVLLASSPSKQTKLAIAPMKSPTKVVTMKGLSTTPKKIAPAPQQVVMSVAGGSPKSLLVSSTSGGTRTIQVVSASSVSISFTDLSDLKGGERRLFPCNIYNHGKQIDTFLLSVETTIPHILFQW